MFGLDYEKIEKENQLIALCKRFWLKTLLFVNIHSPKPIYIELGYTKSSHSKRFVRRPLEDQAVY